MLGSRPQYVALSVAIACAFWIAFNILDQLLFFYPVFAFYLPADAIPQFVISNVTAALMGLVASMNVFLLKQLNFKNISASMFSGASIGLVSGTCASCTSLGFLMISTFGGAGLLASSFLSNFQIPLRLVSIGLLIWAYVSVSKKMTASCVR